jgi:hypothetical protein
LKSAETINDKNAQKNPVMKIHVIAVAVILALINTPNTKADSLTNGLIAHYKFEGNSIDVSGNGNNASPAGNFSYVAEGVSGGGIRIIGDNSLTYSGGGHVMLPTFAGQISASFTYSFWAKDEVIGDSPVNGEAYIAFGALSNERTEVFLNSIFPGISISYDNNSGGGETNLNVGTFGMDWPTFLASWKHIVVTSGAGLLKVYVNGQKYVEWARPFDVFPVNQAALGRHWWDGGATSSARMSATFDNVRIYGRAISEKEVRRMYFNDALINGLVAYYPFSGNANDESGNGHNGSVEGPVLTSDRFYNANAAYQFAGNGDVVRIQPAPNFWSKGKLTFSCWMKIQPGGLYQPRIMSNGTLDVGLTDTSGNPQLFFAGWGFNGLFPTNRLTSGLNYHVAGTYDGTTARVFLNGAEIAATNTAWSFQTTALPLGIGKNLDTGTDWFSGVIDDVRLYDRALSGNEVVEIFERERPNPPLTIQVAGVKLGWFASSNVVYNVEWTTNFQQWFQLTSVLGTGTETNVIDMVESPRRYYRLSLP